MCAEVGKADTNLNDRAIICVDGYFRSLIADGSRGSWGVSALCAGADEPLGAPLPFSKRGAPAAADASQVFPIGALFSRTLTYLCLTARLT